jgi:hypothetical protein
VTIGETKPWDPGIALDHVDHQRNAIGNHQGRFIAAHFRPRPTGATSRRARGSSGCRAEKAFINMLTQPCWNCKAPRGPSGC